MAIGITASQLKAAGFDDESILGHIDEQRPLLKQAGFSDNQIDKFYGIERTTVAPLTDSDVHPLHQPVNTEGKSLNEGQDVSKTWAEKQAEKNPSSANAGSEVNNSSITDENSDNQTYNLGTFGTMFPKSEDRVIVNALGEGSIWVTNINGNFENGDYITTSTIPGYGMKQDDDLLHNYTAAKITQDCNFDLNSTYDCEEFEYNGVTYRRAFVGCTYHCG